MNIFFNFFVSVGNTTGSAKTRLLLWSYSVHSTACMLARFFAEVLNRQPTPDEFKRLYNLLGWKLPKSGNKSLFRRYSAGSEQIRLDNLPDVGQAIIEAIFENEPIMRAPKVKEESDNDETPDGESE